MRAFFDTNVLIYAIGEDQRKADLAWARLNGGGVISVQVLNEFVAVSRGKLKQPWPAVERALTNIRALGLSISPVTLRTHDDAMLIARDHPLHIYDALIVASAQEARCDVLWSEDMADGHRVAGLTIRNPFKASA